MNYGYISARMPGKSEPFFECYVDAHAAQRLLGRNGHQFYRSFQEFKNKFLEGMGKNSGIKEVVNWIDDHSNLTIKLANFPVRKDNIWQTENVYISFQFERNGSYCPNLFRIKTFLTESYINTYHNGVIYVDKNDLLFTVDGDSLVQGIQNAKKKA